ncbi:MAG: TetR-family protein transcriptional regulator [Actinomycetospora sp.]|nr:TetR-family protein transcriptional regulator [Actinomycetospora sp.]
MAERHRRSAPDTRARIHAAATRRFATDGYDGTTVRAVAADAGIDPALVLRYFGSKDGLFAAVTDVDLRIPDLAACDRSEVGALLVRRFLLRWGPDEEGLALLHLLRAAVHDQRIAARAREVFATQVTEALAVVVDDPAERGIRAALVTTQLLGLLLCRSVLGLAELVDTPPERLVDLVGPTVQRQLTGPLEGSA